MQTLPSLTMRTLVVSSASFALNAVCARTRRGPPASEAPARKRRRVCAIAIGDPSRSYLQLAFELVEKAPIGVLGDEPAGQRFDHARFMQAQRVEADGVLGVVFPPFVVGKLADGLEGIVIARGETTIDEPSCDRRGIAGAKLRSLENGTQRALGGDRVLPHVIPVAPEHAAEILGPGTVRQRADDHMAGMPRAQFLGFGRKPQEGIDLPLCEQV